MIWLALRSTVNGGCQSDKSASVSGRSLSLLSCSLSVHFPGESQISPVCRGAPHSTSPQKESHYQLVNVILDTTHTCKLGEVPRTSDVPESACTHSWSFSYTMCTFKGVLHQKFKMSLPSCCFKFICDSTFHFGRLRGKPWYTHTHNVWQKKRILPKFPF